MWSSCSLHKTMKGRSSRRRLVFGGWMRRSALICSGEKFDGGKDILSMRAQSPPSNTHPRNIIHTLGIRFLPVSGLILGVPCLSYLAHVNRRTLYFAACSANFKIQSFLPWVSLQFLPVPLYEITILSCHSFAVFLCCPLRPCDSRSSALCACSPFFRLWVMLSCDNFARNHSILHAHVHDSYCSPRSSSFHLYP